jgi:predicted nucleic acid-binding protein
MTRLLFDVNVLLDVLLDREPWAEASAAAWAAVENGNAAGVVSAHAVTTVNYIVQKQTGAAKALRTMSAILRVFAVAPVNGAVILEALQLRFSDFEDAVTAAAARQDRCDYIITRDPKGFRGSPVRSLTPEAVLPLLCLDPAS